MGPKEFLDFQWKCTCLLDAYPNIRELFMGSRADILEQSKHGTKCRSYYRFWQVYGCRCSVPRYNATLCNQSHYTAYRYKYAFIS